MRISSMFFPHVTVAAVIEKDGKFLMVEETIGGLAVINQPAGHLEDNESLVDAVKREVLEETAWEFKPRHLLGVYRWPQPKKDRTWLRFNFTGEAVRDTGRALDPDIDRALWLPEQEIAALQQSGKLRSPQVWQAMRDYRAGKQYPLDLLVDLI
ncbi:MAG: NUDIX hydrolase [Gammaproteobacteria bacterium]|nr:MAG: NUDIX hydrolase [Gammaproteobacteria bacterium]